MEDVQARLKELRKATADEAMMSVIERKRRLSQIARARYDDTDRAGDPIEDARTKLAAIMNKLPVRIAEAEDVPPENRTKLSAF